MYLFHRDDGLVRTIGALLWVYTFAVCGVCGEAPSRVGGLQVTQCGPAWICATNNKEAQHQTSTGTIQLGGTALHH